MNTCSRRGALPVCVACALVAAAGCSGNGSAESARRGTTTSPSIACAPATVHYSPYESAPANLRRTPWVAATPASSGLAGLLFYWGSTQWGQTHHRTRSLHIYSGGRAPGNGIHTKILWTLRRGRAAELRLQGQRIDHSGTFSQRFPLTGTRQFPSIVNVPRPGCWRLTLKAGKATGRVTVIAVSRKRR